MSSLQALDRLLLLLLLVVVPFVTTVVLAYDNRVSKNPVVARPPDTTTTTTPTAPPSTQQGIHQVICPYGCDTHTNLNKCNVTNFFIGRCYETSEKNYVQILSCVPHRTNALPAHIVVQYFRDEKKQLPNTTCYNSTTGHVKERLGCFDIIERIDVDDRNTWIADTTKAAVLASSTVLEQHDRSSHHAYNRGGRGSIQVGKKKEKYSIRRSCLE